MKEKLLLLSQVSYSIAKLDSIIAYNEGQELKELRGLLVLIQEAILKDILDYVH